MVREDHCSEGTFEQSPAGPEEASHAEFWGRPLQTAEKEGPEQEYAWRLRGQFGTGGAGAKEGGRVGGEEVMEVGGADPT